MTDPMFRQRLRNYWRDTREQIQTVEPGSRAWHKLEALERAISAVHIEIYREAISPIHSGPHKDDASEPPPH